MTFVKSKKSKVDEKIVNLGKISNQACAEVKGEVTEKGDCIAKKQEHAKDPDHVVFEKMRYQKPQEEA